jgi:hypothetical protein
MSIQSLKLEINLPNKITITHTEHNTSALDIRNTATGTCPTII